MHSGVTCHRYLETIKFDICTRQAGTHDGCAAAQPWKLDVRMVGISLIYLLRIDLTESKASVAVSAKQEPFDT